MKKLYLIFTCLILFSACKEQKSLEIKSDTTLNLVSVELIGKDSIPNQKCNFSTYVIYKDSLPIYESPDGKIIQYFRFEHDPEYDFGGGFLFNNSKEGWLQIGKDEFEPELEGLWVQSDYIEIGTTNYAGDTISLYHTPNKSSQVIGFIFEESYLNVIDCMDNWVYVKKGNNEGWLPPEYICTNSQTNCN